MSENSKIEWQPINTMPERTDYPVIVARWSEKYNRWFSSETSNKYYALLSEFTHWIDFPKEKS